MQRSKMVKKIVDELQTFVDELQTPKITSMLKKLVDGLQRKLSMNCKP